MNPNQLLDYIIRPALQCMAGGFDRTGADILLLATAAQESHCGEYLHQIRGPALGIYQCEPATHALVLRWCRDHEPRALCHLDSPDERLVYNLRYATKIARLVYYADPAPLPQVAATPMFCYYKRIYNSPQGAATLEQWKDNWARYVEPCARTLEVAA